MLRNRCFQRLLEISMDPAPDFTSPNRRRNRSVFFLLFRWENNLTASGRTLQTSHRRIKVQKNYFVKVTYLMKCVLFMTGLIVFFWNPYYFFMLIRFVRLYIEVIIRRQRFCWLAIKEQFIASFERKGRTSDISRVAVNFGAIQKCEWNRGSYIQQSVYCKYRRIE